MRVLPAAWPTIDEDFAELPTVYVHVLGTAWPPADPASDCPAGWAEVTDWNIDADLDAPLLPGQINAEARFTNATGACTIKQPEGGLLAPWRSGMQRTPDASQIELWASYNGPLGDTAFLLGQFQLDPMTGSLTGPSVKLSFRQNTIRLRKPHDIVNHDDILGPGPFSPTRLIEDAATRNGFVVESSADFPATLTSIYFPRKTDELTAVTQIVAANLGAMFLSMDGVTIKVRDADYLLGAGAVVDTLDVADDIEDLTWQQDPSALIDRIEVTYLPPDYDDNPFGPAPFYDAAILWLAPRGAKLAAGASVTYSFDPGTDISLSGATVRDKYVYGNSAKDGTGSSADLPADVEQLSSGSYKITITNTTGSTKYLVAPRGGTYPSSDFSKGQRSFLVGTINGASESESARTLTWGVATGDATNTLTVNLSRNIQTRADAVAILNRIVDRVTTPTYVLEDVRIPLDFRRELADLYRASATEVEFDTRALVTGLKLTGTNGQIAQTATLAIMPLRISDFNAAWAGKTIADFNTHWAGKTIADFDAAPLST